MTLPAWGGRIAALPERRDPRSNLRHALRAWRKHTPLPGVKRVERHRENIGERRLIEPQRAPGTKQQLGKRARGRQRIVSQERDDGRHGLYVWRHGPHLPPRERVAAHADPRRRFRLRKPERHPALAHVVANCLQRLARCAFALAPEAQRCRCQKGYIPYPFGRRRRDDPPGCGSGPIAEDRRPRPPRRRPRRRRQLQGPGVVLRTTLPAPRGGEGGSARQRRDRRGARGESTLNGACAPSTTPPAGVAVPLPRCAWADRRKPGRYLSSQSMSPRRSAGASHRAVCRASRVSARRRRKTNSSRCLPKNRRSLMILQWWASRMSR